MSDLPGDSLVAGTTAEAEAAARAAIAAGGAEAVAESLLTELAGDASWRREAALDLLRSLDESAALLPHFANALRDQRHAERRNSARSALAALASPDSAACEAATARLQELLLEEDVDARLLAAAALGESGNARGRLPLERALSDVDANVASAAAESLGLLGDRRAVPSLLLAAAGGELWTRVSAVIALGQLCDPRGLPALASALSHPLIAPAAASAIGEIGDPRGVEMLRETLLGEGDARRVALDTVARLYGANPGFPVPEWLRATVAIDEAELVERLREERDGTAARLLGFAGTPAAGDALLEAASDPDQASIASVGLEGLPAALRIRLAMSHLDGATPGARTILLEALPPLTDRAAIAQVVARLGDEDAETRGAAAGALSRSDADLVLEELLTALKNPQLRLGATLALGRIGGERCAPLLGLLDDGSVEVRAAAAEGLARCGIGQASALAASLDEEEDSRVKQSLLSALGEIGGDPVVPHIARFLRDPDPTLRFTAARALGRSHAADALEPLLETLDDRSPEVRIAALNALGQLGDTRAANVVGGHLDEDSREVRRTAVRALDRLAGESAVARLIVTLGDADREVRMTAVETLRRIGGRAAADALDERVEVEPDTGVRNAATRALLELRVRGPVDH